MRGHSKIKRGFVRRPQSMVYTVREKTTLMEFLMMTLKGTSRTRVKSLLVHRMVSVNNSIVSQYNYPLEPGMLVSVSRIGDTHPFHSPWVDMEYEDRHVIVVNKHPDVLTVGTAKQRNTVQVILNNYLEHKKRGFRVHLVHRLDRATSGLLIFAKDIRTQQEFVQNWQQIITDRRYVAVVEGEMKQEGGTVHSWLTDHKTHVTSSPVDDGGKEAITHFHVLKRGNGFTLIELKLETGRKNQIRVHMQTLGHPIVGDLNYGAQSDPIHRLALHAFRICFYHPATTQLMNFETPLPEEFTKLVDNNQGKK